MWLVASPPSDTFANHTRGGRDQHGALVWQIARLQTETRVQLAQVFRLPRDRASPTSPNEFTNARTSLSRRTFDFCMLLSSASAADRSLWASLTYCPGCRGGIGRRSTR